MTPQEITLLIYNISLFPVVVFSLVFLFISIVSLFVEKKKSGTSDNTLKNYPTVTVQVPSFNDPVAARCIKACMKLDYPADKFHIMILDDSTDKKTQRLLKKFSSKKITYIHRTNRDGYKPGALRDAMPKTTGEIIVIFDADFIPKRDFLKKIVKPFEDPKIAIVQGRQGFLNSKRNLISRFASYLLVIHHTMILPIGNKLNTIFFCGTAGAIRKSALLSAGGWNANSITEDSDLSVKILSKGWKSTYIEFETPSEVPVTIESFIKQQMRWTFGNIRVFFDNSKEIIFGRSLKIRQKIMISFLTLSAVIAPFVVLMTIAGAMGWFTGEPHLFKLSELTSFFIKMFYTSGFLLLAYIALWKYKTPREFPKLLLATFSISIVLAVANSVAVYRAVFMKDKPLFVSKKNSWICTTKEGNSEYTKSDV